MLPYLSMPGESPLLLDQRFDAALERVFAVDGQEVHVSVRVGVALFPADGDSAETLLRNAEAALKRAKALGERRLFYSEEMSRVLREKLDLGNRLRRALQQGEFVLFYQPKLDVRQGSICGAEALIRWRSPELGLVPPNCFVPMLEESGLIVEAGRWALRQAVRDRREWMAQGLPAPRIAVNVSPLQLRRPDFVDMLKDALAEGGAAGIDLEITESALMSDVEEHLDKLRAARGMGLSIAIDDFGTGYSSLAYLTRLPVDAIKIDRSFIMRMTDAADTMNIVATIVSLAHTMKLKVIAEGVETAEQLRFLRLLRCDQMQGFLFSPGLAPAQFAELLKSGQLSLHGMGTRPLAA
jgi:EAL domain-containing protein (putative c-di-GMP-specific phosphodiesterase class I)